MTWIYQGNSFTETPEAYQGFVYMITNLNNYKRYIGKKNFWQTQKLPPLKGKKNRRHRRIETGWRDYWGSNAPLQSDVASLGVHCFRREILHLCTTKSWMSYHETRLQFHYGVLVSPNWYNDYIGCRINPRGLK